MFDSDEALELREFLNQHFGPDHVYMSECDRLIRLVKFKHKIDHKD